MKDKQTEGWVFILSSELGYKFGCSKNLKKRVLSIIAKSTLQHIQIDSHYKVNNMFEVKSHLNQLYKHRIDEGWFRLEAWEIEELVDYLLENQIPHK